MPLGMTHEQVREFCLAVGNLIRASAVWGMEKSTAGNTDFAERAVHAFLEEVLQAGLGRLPSDGEREIVWET